MIKNKLIYRIFGAICVFMMALMLIYLYDVPKFSIYSSNLRNNVHRANSATNRANKLIGSEKTSNMFPMGNQSVPLPDANSTNLLRGYFKNLKSKLNENMNNKTLRKTTGNVADSVAMTTNTTETDIFRKTHLMTISGNGRIGNQMFEFAALLGIADMNGYTPYVTPQHALNKIFDIPQTRDIRMKNSKEIGEVNAGCYDNNLEGLSHQFNWTLRGYYQSWRYFDRVKETVKKSFKFKQHLIQSANKYISEINPGKRPSVGVHIRRRDMNSAYHLARGYSVATAGFIKKAIEYFKKNVVDPVFIVVSDDRDWAERYIIDTDVIHTRSGSPSADLALLANCNHSIVSTGTYGWWGAWLAGGRVVYFRDFPTPGSWLDKRYNKTEYYPPDWIGMV